MLAILFDIGNVLVSYNHQGTIEAVAALYRADPESVRTFYTEIGPQFGVGELHPDDVLDLVNERLGKEVSMDEFTQAFCTTLKRDDAALAYAHALQHDEVVVGAISNTNAIHVAWLDKNATELADLELVIMSNEVGILKPDSEVFELALELLDLPAERVLFVDDAPENVAAARSLGIAGINHTDWAQTAAQIEAWLEAHQSKP